MIVVSLHCPWCEYYVEVWTRKPQFALRAVQRSDPGEEVALMERHIQTQHDRKTWKDFQEATA